MSHLRASWENRAIRDGWDPKAPSSYYTEYVHGIVVGPLLNFDGSLWLALLEDSRNRVTHKPASEVTVYGPKS